MSEDEPSYDKAYVNQICGGGCSGTGKVWVTRLIVASSTDKHYAAVEEQCDACGGSGWNTYGHR